MPEAAMPVDPARAGPAPLPVLPDPQAGATDSASGRRSSSP